MAEKIEGFSYDRTSIPQKSIDTDGDGIITVGEATATPASNDEVLAAVMDQHHNEPGQIKAFLQRITVVNPKRGDEILRGYMRYGKFSEIKQVLWTPSSPEPRLECRNDPRLVDNILTYIPHRIEAGGGGGV
ncbi:MAG: hypothetical protein HY877_07110, partial [Deltaproteobacteria bacterium]|nr:hypothetical protein [Deltaproteobacteria bacterium]